MSGPTPKKPRLPPRWFVRLFWFTHRRVYRLTGGRVGLWRPKRLSVAHAPPNTSSPRGAHAKHERLRGVSRCGREDG